MDTNLPRSSKCTRTLIYAIIAKTAVDGVRWGSFTLFDELKKKFFPSKASPLFAADRQRPRGSKYAFTPCVLKKKSLVMLSDWPINIPTRFTRSGRTFCSDRWGHWTESSISLYSLSIIYEYEIALLYFLFPEKEKPAQQVARMLTLRSWAHSNKRIIKYWAPNKHVWLAIAKYIKRIVCILWYKHDLLAYVRLMISTHYNHYNSTIPASKRSCFEG